MVEILNFRILQSQRNRIETTCKMQGGLPRPRPVLINTRALPLNKYSSLSTQPAGVVRARSAQLRNGAVDKVRRGGVRMWLNTLAEWPVDAEVRV